jgi:hypothetical protein
MSLADSSQNQFDQPNKATYKNASSITMKMFNTFLLLSSVASISGASSIRASSFQHVATMHRDQLIDAIHHKARKLVSSDSLRALAGEDDQTFCGIVEQEMDFEDLGEGAEGECTCTGTVEDTINLSCAFTNICDETEDYCGDITFSISMSNLFDDNDEFNAEAHMDIQACVDVDVTWLDEICFKVSFSGLDLIVPTECEVTYGGKQCSCTVDTVDIEGGTFDMEVPCVMWSCQDVVPELLKPYMVEDTCNATSVMDEEAGPANPAIASLNSLEQIPKEVTTELEAEASKSGAMSIKGMMGASVVLVAVTGLSFAY